LRRFSSFSAARILTLRYLSCRSRGRAAPHPLPCAVLAEARGNGSVESGEGKVNQRGAACRLLDSRNKVATWPGGFSIRIHPTANPTPRYPSLDITHLAHRFTSTPSRHSERPPRGPQSCRAGTWGVDGRPSARVHGTTQHLSVRISPAETPPPPALLTHAADVGLGGGGLSKRASSPLSSSPTRSTSRPRARVWDLF